MRNKKRYQQKKKEINLVHALIITLVAAILIFVMHNFFDFEISSTSNMEVAKATVTQVVSTVETELFEGYTSTTITLNADITSGDYKGQTVSVTKTIDAYVTEETTDLDIGDKIIIINLSGTEAPSWQFSSLNRLDYLFALVIVFFIAIIIIGRLKGITTVFSLLVTFGSLFLVFIPAILCGVNIYLATICITLFIILSSLFLINGFNKKTLCAIIGNIGGILLAGVFAILVNKILNITGILSVEYISLTLLETVTLDLQGIIWSGILIGSLGAVMDVAMTISSAMNEVSNEMKTQNFFKLFRSGMNIGKDAIGTMTNTLILAYVGSSLASILLYFTSNSNLLYLMNMELIVVEVVQAVVGSMGILLCVPITVLFSAWILGSKETDDLDI
ncbi:MAG: YibE/F family protein [Clostridia bacterium]